MLVEWMIIAMLIQAPNVFSYGEQPMVETSLS